MPSTKDDAPSRSLISQVTISTPTQTAMTSIFLLLQSALFCCSQNEFELRIPPVADRNDKKASQGDDRVCMATSSRAFRDWTKGQFRPRVTMSNNVAEQKTSFRTLIAPQLIDQSIRKTTNVRDIAPHVLSATLRNTFSQHFFATFLCSLRFTAAPGRYLCR
jgi:hypothetical protein